MKLKSAFYVSGRKSVHQPLMTGFSIAWFMVVVLSYSGLSIAAEDNSQIQAQVFTQTIHLDAPVGLVWKALTEPARASEYYLAPLVQIDLHAGGTIVYGSVEQPLITGVVEEVIDEKKWVHSFVFDPTSHGGITPDQASRVTYELTAEANSTSLTLTHDRFAGDKQAFANVTQGWPIILNGLSDYLAR